MTMRRTLAGSMWTSTDDAEMPAAVANLHVGRGRGQSQRAVEESHGTVREVTLRTGDEVDYGACVGSGAIARTSGVPVSDFEQHRLVKLFDGALNRRDHFGRVRIAKSKAWQ